jgi:ubiquitin-conjugating enzyme E2 S
MELNPRVLHLVTKQLMSLQANPPLGVTPILNEENYAEVSADIAGPEDTPYHQGVFRVKLELPSDFPVSAPKGYFLTKIFHPNVSPAGEICVNTLKSDWDPRRWSFVHILHVIRCLLAEPFPESALNEEAGRMFMEDYDQYCHHAKLYTSVHAIPKTLGVVYEAIPPPPGSQLRKWLRRT